jgi:hypothetical protein
VQALLHKRLTSKPPASYSFAASEVLRLCRFKIHRAQVRRWAIKHQLAHPKSNSPGGPRSGASAPRSKSAPMAASPSALNSSASRPLPAPKSSSVSIPPAITPFWPLLPTTMPNPLSSSPTPVNSPLSFCCSKTTIAELGRQAVCFLALMEICARWHGPMRKVAIRAIWIEELGSESL